LLLLWLATLVPASWWALLVPDQPLRATVAAGPEVDFMIEDLEVGPAPPAIEIAGAGEEPAPPARHLDPDWWTRAWNARIVFDRLPAPAPAPALPDTLVPPVLVGLLGLEASREFILAAADSVVEARLWQLVQEERLRLTDLDGLFTAIARARAYADMKSREAAMYGEFMFETVPVPR